MKKRSQRIHILDRHAGLSPKQPGFFFFTNPETKSSRYNGHPKIFQSEPAMIKADFADVIKLRILRLGEGDHLELSRWAQCLHMVLVRGRQKGQSQRRR